MNEKKDSWENKYGKVVDGKLKELNIYLDRWGHGEDGGLLLNDATCKRCCIGFMALACGVEEECLINVGIASDLEPEAALKLSKYEGCLDDAYELNDAHTDTIPFRHGKVTDDIIKQVDDSERERLRQMYLTKFFKSLDIDVHFLPTEPQG